MKYQRIIMVGTQPDNRGTLKQFYAPVEQRDGRWMQCGSLVPERGDQMDIAMALQEYAPGDEDLCGPLADIVALPGYRVEARLWLPDNYVPESEEVREEGLRRAAEHLRRLKEND